MNELDVLTKIFEKHNHDLESLAPRFQAERLLELLADAGWTVTPIDETANF